jgi:hypothetical protein
MHPLVKFLYDFKRSFLERVGSFQQLGNNRMSNISYVCPVKVQTEWFICSRTAVLNIARP